MSMLWEVRFSRNASKLYERLKRSGQKKPSIIDVIDFLVIELQAKGPERVNWPNYSKLGGDLYHCHLKKGRPTYIACWRVVNERFKQIEVYYVGTHEGAPY
jgi:hypothetical protein